MIKVNNLSKEFHEQGTSNELLAVDHVDFTIQNGSFCALVGESGSGKSTLAQLMCGLLVPSSGEVLFEGKNISLCRGKQKQVLRSKIQLILQEIITLYPEISVKYPALAVYPAHGIIQDYRKSFFFF